MENVSCKILSPLLLLAVLSPLSSFASDWNTNQNNVVLDGYDVISYKTEDKAIKGSVDYSAKYDGVKFYFKNKDNKTKFLNNPIQYLPEYHGFCAFAMGKHSAEVAANADTFKMYDGKLLMFFNDYYKGKVINTKVLWNANEKNLFTKAQKNWKKMD